MKTTVAGARRRNLTIVPRRLAGPRVEKRRREARTLPVAPEKLWLPLADVELPEEPLA